MPGAPRGRGPTEAEYSALVARLNALERRQDNGRERPSHRADGTGRSDGGGHGSAGRATSAGASGRARDRPGDWQCSHCQAFPCFARKGVCYKCGAPRGGGGGMATVRRSGAGGGLARAVSQERYLGPIGAGGARPMLGGRGIAAASAPAGTTEQQAGPRSPTFRVPGASVAARAEEQARRQSRAMVNGNAADADGFRTIGAGAAPRRTEGPPAANRPSNMISNNSWAALSEEEDAMVQDGTGDDDDNDEDNADSMPVRTGEGGAPCEEGDREGNDDGGEEGEDDVIDERDVRGLRQHWQELGQAYRRMEHDPTMPQSIVAEAKKLRDDAERKWRAAKAPHPLSKRMRWAEADLRAAQQKEELHRAELARHLEAAANRTRELEERIKVDVERTARKRALLQELLAEGVPEHGQGADRIPAARAATAVTGIATDIAPQLAAVIEKLGAPMESDTAENVRQDLQLVAVSLSNLEGLLRGALVPTVPLASAMHQQQATHFHIGSDGIGGGDNADGDGDDARGGKRRALSATGDGTTTATRWTKPTAGAAWTKRTTSLAAKEEAMRALKAHDGNASSAVSEVRSNISSKCGGQQPAAAEPASPTGAQAAGASETNDLAEADRRARQAAQRQFQESQQWQDQRAEAGVQQQEELDRQQRRQRQEEELWAHQQAAQRAADERAADEARQREELISRMSPQELARAAELHAQHMAIGAQAFGTRAASEMAGLVHQQYAHAVARTNAASGMQADAEQLIAMSPEELAQWDREQQATAGEVPW